MNNFKLSIFCIFLFGCSSQKMNIDTTNVADQDLASEMVNFNQRIETLESQVGQWLELQPSVTRLTLIEKELKTLISRLTKMADEQEKVQQDISQQSEPKTKVTPMERPLPLNDNEPRKLPFSMQLHSFNSKSLLEKSWQALLQKHKTIIQDYQPIYEETVINNKTYFRLKLGLFATSTIAKQACKPFSDENLTCLATSSTGMNL